MANHDTDVNHLKDDVDDLKSFPPPPHANPLPSSATETCILPTVENEAELSSSSLSTSLLHLRSPTSSSLSQSQSIHGLRPDGSSSSSLSNPRILSMQSGRSSSASSSFIFPLLPLPASTSSSVTATAQLLLLVNDDNSPRRTLISRRCSVGLARHTDHYLACSATPANVNAPTSSPSSRPSLSHKRCKSISTSTSSSDFLSKIFHVEPAGLRQSEEAATSSLALPGGNLIKASWSIGDFIRRHLLRKVVVIGFCSGSTGTGIATGQTISLGIVETAYKSSDAERNSRSQQSSTSTEQGTDKSAAHPQETKMKEEKQLEFILKSLVAGGVAGMCAKTTVAPLDRMKILLQAHSKHYSHLGVFSGLRGIVQKERFIALYKGNGAQMVRIFPYAATQFTSFELYKKFFGEDSHVARFAAGSAAGVTAVALTYPLDTIRARLAFQVTGEHVYSGIYSCALHIFREEGGIRALYRGFIPTVCGMIPYAGLSFYCFESFKYLCMKYLPTYTCKSHSTNTGGLVLLLYAKLMCGGVAGAAAQTVAYPLDVTRRRMQLAMMNENTKKFGLGMVSTIKLIYEENGVMRGLYRGMSINYLRAIPMVAVSFSTYELVKQMLSLDTGLAIKTG